jgi:hypothetical protein
VDYEVLSGCVSIQVDNPLNTEKIASGDDNRCEWSELDVVCVEESSSDWDVINNIERSH